MSSQELVLREGNVISVIRHVNHGCFTIDIAEGLTFKQIGLDRNQAHLLMLYLQEHLGYNKVEVTEPKMWLCCQCGKYHMKNFVCTMLK